MKALMVHGHELRLESVPDPQILDPRDAIVRITATSICGSDLHLLEENWAAPREVYGIGHEGIGEVLEVGSAVSALRPGQRVMLAGSTGCGLCAPCLTGAIKRCRNGKTDVYGLGQSLEGCQAEAVRVPASDFNAAPIPDGVSDEQAVLLTDGLVTAYAACRGAEISAGRSVAVVGLGPIGLMAVELAVTMGASTVYAIDPIADRRARAAALGAIGLAPGDAREHIEEATNGLLIDSVIEAVGRTETVDLALSIVGSGRAVDILGAGHFGISVPFEAALKGVTVRVNMLTEIARYWPEIIPLLQAGRIRPENVFTDRLPLADGLSAYKRAQAREDGLLKLLLHP